MAQVRGDCVLPNCPLQKERAVLPLPPEMKRRLAEAYAAQSLSDFRVYQDILQNVEECHRLHYLQMACEKIAKAYRLRDTPDFPEENLYSHVFFAKFIENFLASPQIKKRYQSQDSKRRQMVRDAKRLSQEIQKLAPAVDREQTPSNVEYPWIVGDAVFTPCSYAYGSLSLLRTPGGREFLKMIKIAIEDYKTTTLLG